MPNKVSNIDVQVERVQQQFRRLADNITEAMAQELEAWGKEVIEHGNNTYVPKETGALKASGFATIAASGSGNKKRQVLTIGWGGATPKPGTKESISDAKNAPDGIVRYAGLQEDKHKFMFNSVRDKLPELPKKTTKRFKEVIRVGKGGGSKVSDRTAPLRAPK